MKKLFKEFKTFITRGNVVDLAVGMIIGAAFTAIVSALVNSVFKPLIDWIPLGNHVNGLRTVLGDKYYLYNEEGVRLGIDWEKTNYIDWGAFISAIINFLLVALILFLIIKTINNVHKAGQEAKAKLEEKVKGEEEKKKEE